MIERSGSFSKRNAPSQRQMVRVQREFAQSSGEKGVAIPRPMHPFHREWFFSERFAFSAKLAILREACHSQREGLFLQETWRLLGENGVFSTNGVSLSKRSGSFFKTSGSLSMISGSFSKT